MTRTRMTSTDWLLAAAGPLAIGAIVGAQGGALAIAQRSVTLPLILLGVAAVMLPALYIGTSLIGAAPPARDVAAAFGRGFRACGVSLLGLAAPAAFLLATSRSDAMGVALGALITAVGAFAGLRVISGDLFSETRDAFLVRCVFGVWALVSLGIGLRLYTQFMAA